MTKANTEPRYRLVVFEAVDDRVAVRDLFCKVTHLHPTDATQWVAKAPGAWPWPLPADQTRALLDGLYDLGVAAEAWLVEKFPDLAPPRTIHNAACLAEGFRVEGLRGEPTHWVAWNKIELICAGSIEAEDEFHAARPLKWSSAAVAAFRAFTLSNPRPFERKARAMRVPRDPVGELIIVRKDPLLALRVVETQMNYAYLGDRLKHSAAENFPIFVSDLVARADSAYITPSTKAWLKTSEPAGCMFPSSQALLDYATHRLLWGWYQRDREREGKEGGDDDRPKADD